MVTFFKVVCSPKNILKTIPLALLLLFVTALWPVGIACSNGFCTYRYGFFAWLELIRMDEQPMKNRIHFHVMQGADGFFVPLLNLAASMAVCHFAALLIYKCRTGAGKGS